MISLLIPLLLRCGLTQAVADRVAKPLLIALAVLIAIALLSIAKCSYDASIITAHDDKRDVQITTGARQADGAASDERRADDAQISNEADEVKNATDPIPDQPTSPRQHARACVILRQQARASGAGIPAGC